MAEKKAGKVVYRQTLSPVLEIFRIGPADGQPFPPYKSGQYIALSRENCRLTKKSVDANGEKKYIYDVDEQGNIKRGPVTHSYSIASAPYETERHGYVEFYVGLQVVVLENPGRLTESLFLVDPEQDNVVAYVNKIAGGFTLDKAAESFQNVVLVGTGTGLAPFISMIKQLHFEATQGRRSTKRFTLFHANRTVNELGYHEELVRIEKERLIDFVYVPSVSRPAGPDHADDRLGKGRANNLLRSVFSMPLMEEEALRAASDRGAGVAEAQNALNKTERPILPVHRPRELLLDRMDPKNTVILTCGNPDVMEDIRQIAAVREIPFEKEDW